MKIEHIEAITLRFEYATGFSYAGGTCTGRLTTLVRVHTDTGHVGIGSGYTHPSLMHLIVEQQLAPLLLGEDPTDVERLWDHMYGLTRWYGRKGAAMTALGALDTAFWDLRGQQLGKPVWQLLGGDSRHCPAYGSALLWKEVPELADEASRLVERGFRRVKTRLARDRDYDAAAVRAIRQAIGPECDLMVDGSMRYDHASACELSKLLAEEGVFWFEEPFPPEDLDAFVIFREQSAVPVAAGENEFGSQGFRELIRAGAVDIVQPDASRCGGITETHRVCQAAHKAGLRAATHSWSDAVAIIANAHVIAAAPNGVTVEVDATGNPFVESLLAEPMSIDDGRLTLSSAPGFGIELDDRVIEQYRVENPLQIPAGCYSDMVVGKEHFQPALPYT